MARGFDRTTKGKANVPAFKDPGKELTDEIREIRRKNKEFQATNEHDTYLIVCFSTTSDKKKFLASVGMERDHTIVDGYTLATRIGAEPEKPGFRLQRPLKSNPKTPK